MQVEVGAVLEGKVTGLTNFGAFVELEGGVTGMVHISEVAGSYVNDIKDHLVISQIVKVKVLSVGDDGKISLSIKKAIEPEQQAARPQRTRSAPVKRQSGSVWQGPKSTSLSESSSFEDMISKFKQVSEEKMTDIKHSNEAKHGGGYSRRGGKK
ncbi:MAG: S1 RNA-binding domain-containing protein [Clostridiales bacterium]|nr:S1 RNA-binding domain-containing protein [Clostridiales bacterium]